MITQKNLDFESISSWKNLSEEKLLCARESFAATEAKLNELESCKKIVFPELYNQWQEVISRALTTIVTVPLRFALFLAS